jgi:eukaryotic-like serine/threonine-protein kinase
MSSSPPPAARPPPSGLAQPGDIIGGKYEVERILGMGGMGVVLAARHLELDEPVAIKMLLPHLPASGEAAARFVREAKAAIRIRNEHVVRVLDVARTPDGSPYIVMERLDGCDLGQLVDRDGPLPVEDAVEYVLQACEAIAVAHALGIVHRDLKPANLFLAKAGDGEPCVKVLDFGISKLSEPSSSGSPGLTSTATVMGTPCFMSPEQLRSTRDVDARADIWSMGAILHALLAGRPPYDGESSADVSAKIIRDAPTPLRELRPDVPSLLENAVLRCLEKSPDARFQDVPALADALAQAVECEDTKATAARVARVAVGTAATAATVRASSDPDVQIPSMRASPAMDPTRTASAWGETRREEQRKRRIAWGVVAGGLLCGGTIFGALRWHASSVASGSTATPGLSATVGAGAASTTPAPSVAPSAAAPTSAFASAMPSSSAVAWPAASASVPGLASSRPSGKPPAVRSGPPASSARPAVTAPPTKPTGGLFDGRE